MSSNTVGIVCRARCSRFWDLTFVKLRNLLYILPSESPEHGSLTLRPNNSLAWQVMARQHMSSACIRTQAYLPPRSRSRPVPALDPQHQPFLVEHVVQKDGEGTHRTSEWVSVG